MKGKALVPDFYGEFHCTGKNCRYTCCREWAISLTKNDYMNAKKIKKSPELQKLFDIAYKRDKKNENPAVCGKIVHRENGFCPMLSEDGLCLQQLECGYKSLSTICRIYPREFSGVSGNAVECSLSPACEEVTRILFEHNEPIAFENEPEFYIESLQDALSKNEQEPLHNHYWDIKTLCLAVLQADEYDLADRLLILGVAIKAITEMEPEKIPAYVDGLLSSDDLDYLVESFKDIKVDPVIAIGEFAAAVVPIAMESKNTKKIITDILETFGIEVDGENYKYNSVDCTAKKAQFEQFNKKYPRAMENLLIAVMTGKALPFYGGTADIWRGYAYIVMLYNLYKHTIIAVMEEDVPINTVIDAVTWISRCIVHNSKYRDVLLDAYESNESYSLAHMAMIIKG